MTATVTVTVKGGFWEQYGSTFTLLAGKGPLRRMAAMALSRKSTMPIRHNLRILDGAVAGSTSTKNLARVANSTELGGVRTIETEALVNRATTAADVTETKADLLSLSTRTYNGSPVANGDKNPLGTR